jgi:hypothetical protein
MKYRNLLYLMISCLVCMFVPRLAHADASADCAALANGTPPSGSKILISKNVHPPNTATNLATVTVCGVNVFRYGASIQTQSTISNPQAPVAGLVPAGGGSTPKSAPANAAMHTQDTKEKSTPTGTHKSEEEVLQDRVTQLQKDSQDLADQFTTDQIQAGDKIACYQDLANKYPDVLLSVQQETDLKAAVKPCLENSPAPWGESRVTEVRKEIDLAFTLEEDLANFQTTEAYKKFIDPDTTDPTASKAVYATMITTTTGVVTQLQGLINPTTFATYNAQVRTGSDWDARAEYVAKTTDPWTMTLALTCHVQWFGKTESQTVSLPYTDYSQATPSQAANPFFSFTNACLSSLTVSSGLGFSTVRNSTYAFEPKTDYTANPPTTTQVIGYSSNPLLTLFYVGQMNYSYVHPEHSIGLHVAGGAGVSTSSAGTTGDLFLGNAFSFFHRAIFVTPAAHFTQRQVLMPGYAVGNPQASLSSIPVTNAWKTGFAITITFPVVQ